MNSQTTPDQNEARNPTTGNWITIIAGCLFIISLFLDWATAGGFLFSRGTGFLIGISHASGLPQLFILTLLAAIGSILLGVPALKRRLGAARPIRTIQIVLAVIGLLPFGFLPFELSTWMPDGRLVFGGWLALLAALGLLAGAVQTFKEE